MIVIQSDDLAWSILAKRYLRLDLANRTPGRVPLVNSIPAFSRTFLIAAKVSGLPADLPRSIA